MPSSKGKPTDPKLREEVKEGSCIVFAHVCVDVIIKMKLTRPSIDVKQMPNKDGGGKGQMAAWKVSRDDRISFRDSLTLLFTSFYRRKSSVARFHYRAHKLSFYSNTSPPP